MAKVAIGFVLGFLACVWTYELDATDAFTRSRWPARISEPNRCPACIRPGLLHEMRFIG